MRTENCRGWDCSGTKGREWTREGELKRTQSQVGETCLHVTAEPVCQYLAMSAFVRMNLGGTTEARLLSYGRDRAEVFLYFSCFMLAAN